MSGTLTLSNSFLEVTIRIPDRSNEGCRFDTACAVEQVVLNGRHTFCQPEQVHPENRSSGGTGLISEFVWDQVACETPPGKPFPKLGVGLLTQVSGGGAFNKWNPYKIQRFERHWHGHTGGISFVEEPLPCAGYAARIHKDLTLYANTITVTTTVENVGEKRLDLLEYQHNFVAIDGLPAGPGHKLWIPCDSQLAELEYAFHDRAAADRTQQAVPAAQVLGEMAVWTGSMEGKTFFKVTSGTALRPSSPYMWKLGHTQSDASMMEISHFAPEKLVLWGAEHCICAEVFAGIHVKPSHVQTFSRTWIFEDDATKG